MHIILNTPELVFYILSRVVSVAVNLKYYDGLQHLLLLFCLKMHETVFIC